MKTALRPEPALCDGAGVRQLLHLLVELLDEGAPEQPARELDKTMLPVDLATPHGREHAARPVQRVSSLELKLFVR